MCGFSQFSVSSPCVQLEDTPGRVYISILFNSTRLTGQYLVKTKLHYYIVSATYHMLHINATFSNLEKKMATFFTKVILSFCSHKRDQLYMNKNRAQIFIIRGRLVC